MKNPLKKLKQINSNRFRKVRRGAYSQRFFRFRIYCGFFTTKFLNLIPKIRLTKKRYFILSKGTLLLVYTRCWRKKVFFPLSELENFGKFDSMLGGHPDRNKVPGVEASTGSLGHGFPISIGVALGLKIKKSTVRSLFLSETENATKALFGSPLF